MENEILSSIDDIRNFLDSLPPVNTGYRRVLRGQRKLYGSLKPAELRSRHPRKLLFKMASQLIVANLEHADGSDPINFLVWTEVIAQHYGPGSAYLDVTTSLDVALWFGLNELRRTELQLLMGAPGPIDPANDARADLWAFQPGPQTNDHGYLMVLDVPMAEDASDRRHGATIDLSEAPASLDDSSRIANQEALLTWADASNDGGDLNVFLVHAPVRVAAEVRGQIDPNIRCEYLFPSPSLDPWYHRLLSVPLVLEPGPENDELCLGQAIPVAIYGRDEESIWEVTASIIGLQPPILADELRRELRKSRPDELAAFLPEDTTIILLEEPLFLAMPRIDSDQWFDEVAVKDLPDEGTVRATRVHPSVRVQLQRVYYEFSPLGLSDWHQVEVSGESTTFQSGAYLERSGEEFRLWLVTRGLPFGEHRVHLPVTFVFDDTAKQFAVQDASRTLRDARLHAPFQLKTLLVMLSVIRNLSYEIIPAPFAAMTTDQAYVLPLTGRFELVSAVFAETPLFLLRSEGSDDLPDRKIDKYGIQVIARQ